MTTNVHTTSHDGTRIYTQVDTSLSETRALLPRLPGLGIEELRAILVNLQKLTDLAYGETARPASTLPYDGHGAPS